ncbi:MAG: hypothetical protein AVDCRST_MAG67-435, partial [uncultured Solirubrobacteraceae bacterium]
ARGSGRRDARRRRAGPNRARASRVAADRPRRTGGRTPFPATERPGRTSTSTSRADRPGDSRRVDTQGRDGV